MPTVPDLHSKKTKEDRHGKKWTDILRSVPGQLARRKRHRRSTYCCCGTPPPLGCCWTHVSCISLLSTPLSSHFGPGLEGASEGRSAWQLDGDLSFHSSRRQLLAWLRGGGGGVRSWTGSRGIRFLRLTIIFFFSTKIHFFSTSILGLGLGFRVYGLGFRV